MNIKKVFILIGFVVGMLGAKSAFACDIYYVADCPVAQANNYNPAPIAYAQAAYGADTPSIQPVYTPALPQIYDNAPLVQQAPVQYGNAPIPAPVTGPVTPVTQPTIPPQSYYISQPTYIPGSPIIFNGDGTYTEQNSGKTIGTKTTTSGGNAGSTSSNTTSDDTNGSILGGIFGSKKTVFSNNTAQADENLRALVNSKGLAMGTNGACGSEYLILYKNITGQPLTNVAVRISLPDGIVPTNTTDGSYSERDNTVTLFIGSLAKNQEGQIVLATKREGTVTGVARTEMVYTLPDQNQNMIVSYAFGEAGACNNGNALGASASGAGLFGGTLLGWLFLALFVCAFLYLIRFFLSNKKNDAHGHAHAH